MLRLQDQGCHNINFVTPSHVIAQILEALPIAVKGGLHVPLVYNTNGYDRVAALKLLGGIVDIYMPDFKFWDSSVAKSMCNAPDYPERARLALLEMHRQVGDLKLDAKGVAKRGILLRHLVMPKGLAGSEALFHFIAEELSRNTYINVMDQYRPCAQAVGDPDIGRRTTAEEYEEAINLAAKEGLMRLDERRRRWIMW
jgi:putative pyruvate formate lyase activating enzyme